MERLESISRNNKIKYFGGYASGLYEYARCARANNINDLRFNSVISWGDKLFGHYRKEGEGQFNSKVYDTYGSTEGFVLAGPCEYFNYHVLSPHVYLEVLDERGREVPNGEMGYVIITRLDAYAMPLIRYRLGDMVIKDDNNTTCPCGRPFGIIRKIVGRDTDLVQAPSGKKLIVHFFTGIMEHIPEILQFKVVQERQN